MALAKQKKLKKSDLIATSKDGPYELLAVAWDVIKRSEPNETKPNSKDSAESNLHTKTTNLKSILVAIFEDIANPSNKAKYISISSTIAGLFAFLFLSFTFISALFSIAGIIFGCVAVLGFRKYRPAGYVGICLCFLALICLVSAVNDRNIAEQKQKIAEQKQLEYGNQFNQEMANRRLAIKDSTTIPEHVSYFVIEHDTRYPIKRSATIYLNKRVPKITANTILKEVLATKPGFQNEFIKFAIMGENTVLASAVYKRIGKEITDLEVQDFSKEYAEKFKISKDDGVIGKWLDGNTAHKLYFREGQFEIHTQYKDFLDSEPNFWLQKQLSFDPVTDRFITKDNDLWLKITHHGFLIRGDRPGFWTISKPVAFSAEQFAKHRNESKTMSDLKPKIGMQNLAFDLPLVDQFTVYRREIPELNRQLNRSNFALLDTGSTWSQAITKCGKPNVTYGLMTKGVQEVMIAEWHSDNFHVTLMFDLGRLVSSVQSDQ